MKTSYVVIFLFFTHFAFGQLQESFTDSNFTVSPVWLGDSSCFKINANKELQSRGPAATSVNHLYTSSTRLSNTEWSFYVRLEFDPSTTNYAKIYLASNQPDLENNLNGYYIRIGGETGSVDGIDLYRQSGSSSVKIIDGISGHAGKAINSLRIKVIHELSGKWTLYADTLGGNNYSLEGIAIDSTFSAGSYFGIVCVHTSTRKDLFYFDDFVIKEAPLSVVNAIPKNDSLVQLSFNKKLDSTSAVNPANYFINNAVGNPLNVNLINPCQVELLLNKKLKTCTYSTAINNIKDIDGLAIASGTSVNFNYIKPIPAGAILISEIFPDPSPAVGLPGEEYVELYNATADTIDLSGFTLSDPGTSSVFSSFLLAPHSYLLLCNKNIINEFDGINNILGLASWPALNNSSDYLYLKDATGKLICEINYSDTWYKSVVKKEGGWSLEMINFTHLCAGENNWSASENTNGGTPGMVNSIYSNIPDITSPQLLQLEVIDSLHFKLSFNENIDTLISSSFFTISGGSSVSNTKILDSKNLEITLNASLNKNITYSLVLTGLKDCSGNLADEGEEYLFALAERGNELDILINEVLFNPRQGGVDFIEIYNNSEKIIDLKNWQLANFRNDTISDNRQIVTNSLIIYPGEYYVITSDKSILQSHYYVPFPDKILEIPSLPSYSDDKGTVILLNNLGKVIDRFDYNESYHFSILDDKEGVSLERISFASNSNNPDNWHSAASTTGYATPTYKNSQYYEIQKNQTISIDPKIFTPDQDGYKDAAFINYKMDEPGNIGNIRIYDIKGREIKKIAQNQLLASEGFFQWDGTNNDGQKMNIGYYIIYFEIFNQAGTLKTYKETVILGGKF